MGGNAAATSRKVENKTSNIATVEKKSQGTMLATIKFLRGKSNRGIVTTSKLSSGGGGDRCVTTSEQDNNNMTKKSTKEQLQHDRQINRRRRRRKLAKKFFGRSTSESRLTVFRLGHDFSSTFTAVCSHSGTGVGGVGGEGSSNSVYYGGDCQNQVATKATATTNRDGCDHVIDDTFSIVSMSYRSNGDTSTNNVCDADDAEFVRMANKLQRQRLNRTRTKALLCHVDQQNEICQMFQGVNLQKDSTTKTSTTDATEGTTTSTCTAAAAPPPLRGALDRYGGVMGHGSLSSSIPSTISDGSKTHLESN